MANHRKKNPKKSTLERREYDALPRVKKARAARNKARRQMEREGKVRKGDGKDVDHKKPLRNGGTSSRSNLRVRSRSANRADAGGKGGRKKGK